MKVTWLNERLTFQGETPEEWVALNSAYVAFGNQIENEAFGPVEEEFESDTAKFVDCSATSESVHADH
jgi:hypothetical protein